MCHLFFCFFRDAPNLLVSRAFCGSEDMSWTATGNGGPRTPGRDDSPCPPCPRILDDGIEDENKDVCDDGSGPHSTLDTRHLSARVTALWLDSLSRAENG